MTNLDIIKKCYEIERTMRDRVEAHPDFPKKEAILDIYNNRQVYDITVSTRPDSPKVVLVVHYVDRYDEMNQRSFFVPPTVFDDPPPKEAPLGS